jgi:endonuclease G
MIRFLILFFLLSTSCSKQESTSSQTQIDTNSNTSLLNRVRVDSLLVSNNIFQISYNEKHEQPNWVKYTVRDIVKNADRDGMQFYTVDSIYTSDDDDYYSNRWDRGHMAPAGSFNDSYENLYSTFSYTNVALQYDDLNRGVWVDLEEQVRQWADELGDIDIEIYLEFGSSHIILDTGAHVPTAF